MRISDWSSDVCSSDLIPAEQRSEVEHETEHRQRREADDDVDEPHRDLEHALDRALERLHFGSILRQYDTDAEKQGEKHDREDVVPRHRADDVRGHDRQHRLDPRGHLAGARSEEHTSELQSLMRISYAVFCLKKKKHKNSN